MIQFQYHARSFDGNAIHGQMTAASLHAVAEHLRERLLVPIDIRPQRNVDKAVAPLRKVSGRTAMIVVLRTLGTLLQIGVPLRRALQIVLQSTRTPSMREAISAVIASVETGQSLGEAMRVHPVVFSEMTVALVYAGERGGVLAETLERHAENLEKQQALMRRFVTTMIYPLIVVVSALGLVIFLMISVLPMFATLFDQLHFEQPLMLRLILCLSANMTALNAGLLCAALTLMTLFMYRFLRRQGNRADGVKVLLRVPLLDELKEKAATARFARALATLLKAGVPLPEALACVIPVVALPRFRVAITRTRDGLSDGNTLACGLESQGTFHPLFLHLVRVGEETGTLDVQLLRLAEWFERDFTELTARAAALIEPLLIVGIGAVVGTIVFSVFVPLYSLIGGIK